MNTHLHTKYQHCPTLTLIGGDFVRYEKILEPIAQTLAGKSIDILMIHRSESDVPAKVRTHITIDNSYDTVFLDSETITGDTNGKGSERLDMILSQHYLSYDLVIFCQTTTEASEHIEVYEGSTSQGEALFRVKDDDPHILAERLYDWLLEHLLTIPVWGCVLIGGKSSRMGRPKHLIRDGDDITWGENIVNLLSGVTERVILSGSGEIPKSLTHLQRLVDIPNAQGPLAGILAAMRWNPHVSFIVAACDMPGISNDSLSWLLERRRPGCWGTVPLHPETKRFEPLFAYYDRRSRVLFERLLQKGSLRPNQVCKADKIETPVIPLSLADAWRNYNTPEDLGAQ